MKEDEEASSSRLTTEHGLYHELSVAAFVLKFSGSSFPPRAWWLVGFYGKSNHTQLGIKDGDKMSKNQEMQKRTIP